MTDEQNEIVKRTGHVKWFDPGKGFGFVVADEGGPDILLHANVLRNFGQSSVADGTGIVVMVQRTDRGVQAIEVLRIDVADLREDDDTGAFVDIDPAVLAATPLSPARVKWFDKSKGFGFANVFGSPDDIFVHVDVLRRSGLSELEPGEAIGLRVVEGARGRMAAEVNAWEAACKSFSKP